MKTTTIIFLLLISNILGAQNFEWATRAGGNDDDDVFDNAIDDAGNLYATGYFKNTAYFGEGGNQVSLTSEGGADIFFAKYNPYGELIWAKRAGGSTGFDWGTDIALDSENNIIITGYFDAEASFGEGGSSITLTATGDDRDIFICKYSNSGDLLWAYNAGGDYDDAGSGLSIDDDDNIFVVGNFKGSAVFGAGGNALTISSAGGGEDQDGFVAKYNSGGNLAWAVSFGFAEGSDGLSDVELGNQGNIFVSGYKYSGYLPYYDPLVGKFNSNGDVLWLDSPTGVSNDNTSGLAIDEENNCYITGYFTIDLTFGDSTLLAGNEMDLTNIFLAKYSSDGDILWAKCIPGTGGPTPFGGDLGDEGRDINIDDDGYIYLTGYISGTTTFGNDCHTVDLITESYKDIFVAKLNGDADLQWAIRTGGSNNQTGSTVYPSNGHVYLSGYYQTSANIGGNYLGGFGGWSDIFIADIQDQTTNSDYVKNLVAEVTGWAGNASDITINFDNALNEETLSEYRFFIVKSESAEDFDLESANTNSFFNIVIPDGSEIYSINPDENSKDSDGDDVLEDVAYKIFVLSLADGNIANFNSLSCESNEITISINTGDFEAFLENISIYPNPTNKILNLTGFSQPSKLKITDITGKVICTMKHIPMQIDLSNYSKGIYIFRFQTENRIFSEKLIIK